MKILTENKSTRNFGHLPIDGQKPLFRSENRGFKHISVRKTMLSLIPALLMVLKASAQLAIPGLYLHHDQPYYVSGESLRYASYAFDDRTGTPDNNDRIVNVWLIGPKQRYQDQILSANGHGHGVFHLPDTIATGVYQLIAFVGSNNANSRGSFKKYIQILNEEDRQMTICEQEGVSQSKMFMGTPSSSGNPVVLIESAKSTYKTREEIELSLTLTEATTGSVSITKRKLQKSNQIGFSHYFNQGRTVDFNTTETVGRNDTYDSIRIKGTIFNEVTGEPLAKNTVTLSIPSQEELYLTNTDEDGKIDFPVKLGHGQYTGIFHTFDNKVFHQLRFEAQASPPSSLTINYQTPCDQSTDAGLTEQWVELIENRVIEQAYGFPPLQKRNDRTRDFLSDLFDDEVILDEYESIENMRTVFSGIVPNVSITNNPKRPIKMYPKESTFSYKQLPLFYVDGSPTYDYEWIMALEPDEIISIGIIASSWKLAVFGKAGSNGIVVIKSATGDLKPPLSPNMFRISGYSDYRSEPLKLSTTEDDRSPVLSTLLYWDPDFVGMKGNNQLLIPTGDATGVYEIRFEGFSISGKPVSQTAEVEILNEL